MALLPLLDKIQNPTLYPGQTFHSVYLDTISLRADVKPNYSHIAQ